MAREERIFEVVSKVYVIADNEAEAMTLARAELQPDSAREIHDLDEVDEEWVDSMPFIDPKRDPWVELTLRQIFSQDES